MPPIIGNTTTATDVDAYGMTPVRPGPFRFGSTTTATGKRSPIEHLMHPSERIEPWHGAATSPGIAVSPEAVDYFHTETENRESWRAVRNLSFVAGGRTMLSLGLAGVLEGFVPGPLGSTITLTPAPSNMTAVAAGTVSRHSTQLYHPTVFGLGLAAAIIGLTLHTIGLAAFYRDTASINLRRARIMLAIGTIGAVLVTAGGSYYLAGILKNRSSAVWEALPMRSVGNFLVFGAIPNSFSSSEIVHGNTPIRNRVFWRDVFFASGGMFMMTWAQISAPKPPAPLYARELAQCFGIICIAIGGALPRVDTMRAQSSFRLDHRKRRSSRL